MARKTYKVKKGDSYFKIAERLWGNQLFAGQLIKENPGINKLFPGIVLRLPKVDVNDPEPWFGQAAWGRAQGMEGKRKQDRQKMSTQQRRGARLPDKLGLDLPEYGPEEPPRRSGPSYEYDPAYARPRGTLPGLDSREDTPDWFRELPDGVFGPFTKEEAWAALNEYVTLAKKLGLVPGPEVDEQEVVSQEALKDWEAIREAGEGERAPGGKVLAMPAQQGETPTPEPGEEDEGLAVLDTWRAENLMLAGEDAWLKGLVSDTFYRVRDMYLRGAMDLEEVRDKYGEVRGPAGTPTATPGPTPTPWDQYYYTVKENDTLWGISNDLGIDLEKIKEDNPGLDVDNIKPGQKIIIKTSEEAAATQQLTPVPTPTPWPSQPPAAFYLPKGGTLKDIQEGYIQNYSEHIPIQAILDANTDMWKYNEEEKRITYREGEYQIPLSSDIKWDVEPVGFEEFKGFVLPEHYPSKPPGEWEPIFSAITPENLNLIIDGEEIPMVSYEEWSVDAHGNLILFRFNTDTEDIKYYGPDWVDEYKTITVHQSYETNLDLPEPIVREDGTLDYSNQVRAIQDAQMNIGENSLAGIAYNFIITPNGTVYVGRDMRILAAGVEDFNTGNVSVVFVGNFDEGTPTPEAQASFNALTGAMVNTFPNIGCIGQHNHFNQTDCPGGQEMCGWLDTIRREHGMGSYQCYEGPGK